MSQREDTCIGKPCPFWKKYKEKCPNFVEGAWVTNEGHTYVTKDCAPKRAMILCQQVYDQMIGTRKDYNLVRNANAELIKIILEQDPNTIILPKDNTAKQIEG